MLIMRIYTHIQYYYIIYIYTEGLYVNLKINKHYIGMMMVYNCARAILVRIYIV
jgi:hypothetical protein